MSLIPYPNMTGNSNTCPKPAERCFFFSFKWFVVYMVKQLQYIYSSVAILLILCLFSLILFVSKNRYFCCQGDGFMSCLANKVMCKWLSALQSSWCSCLVGDFGDLGVVAFSACFDAVLAVRLGFWKCFSPCSTF